MQYREVLDIPHPRPMSVSAKDQVRLGSDERSQGVSSIYDWNGVRARVRDLDQVMMHYDNSTLTLMSPQVSLQPNDLAMPDLSFISLRSGCTHDDQRSVADPHDLSRTESFFEEQVPGGTIVMISTRHDYVPATKVIEPLLGLPILAQKAIVCEISRNNDHVWIK